MELLCSAATNSEALGSRRGELGGAHTMGDTMLQSTLLVIFQYKKVTLPEPIWDESSITGASASI